MPPSIKLAPSIRATSLIVFDLDGVITDEKPYWDSAREAVNHLLTCDLGLDPSDVLKCIGNSEILADSLPPPLIYWLKNRAINCNWDVAYVSLCTLLCELPDRDQVGAALDRITNPDGRCVSRRAWRYAICPEQSRSMLGFFENAGEVAGTQLIRYAGNKLAALLPIDQRPIAEHYGALFQLCHKVCQRIHDERMRSGEACHAGVMARDELGRILSRIRRDFQVRLGVATGRTRREAVDALGDLALLVHFDERRIVTHDDVAEAEDAIRRIGKSTPLGKPHPFVLLKAIYPEMELGDLLSNALTRQHHDDVIFVGDTPSDVFAAKAVGACSVGILGAVRDDLAKDERRRQLLNAGCDFLADTIWEIGSILEERR